MAQKSRKTGTTTKSTARRQVALVEGAKPYQPKMSKAVALGAVETDLGERVRLRDFRPTVTPLSLEERNLIIDQAEIMLEQVFVHLPLKRAMHVTDPVQRLRLLRLRHRGMDERAFQSEMIDIFTDLRDLHTNYILPRGYWAKFAFLPFRIEEFHEDTHFRQYLISWISPVNTDKNLKEGVIVTHWNGSPVELAVGRNAEREAGCNPDARRARGIEALTLRWFGMSLPPDEDWVTLTYTDGNTIHESKFDWEVVDNSDLPPLLMGTTEGARAGQAGSGWGIDLKTALLQEVRKAVFDPQAIQVEEEREEYRAATAAPVTSLTVPQRPETSIFSGRLPPVWPSRHAFRSRRLYPPPDFRSKRR